MMKESFIKFIIIALAAFFSVSMAYAEADYSKPIWNKVVTIGYELDHFSPIKQTNKDDKSFLVRTTNKKLDEIRYYIKEGKKYEKDYSKISINAFVVSFSAYVAYAAITFLILSTIGIGLLIVVKWLKHLENKS